MTGQQIGDLTKRHAGSIAGRAMLDKRATAAYTAAEQANVTSAYTDVSNDNDYYF